jgi:thiol-disulfide isomerase/thioredoxin
MSWNRFFSFATRRVCRATAALACIALVGACSKSPPPKPEIALGKPFPPLTLGAASANALADPSLRGNVLVLNIWATWCPPCRREMPSLERLSKTLDPKRFAVLGLSTDQDERLAAEFLFQNGITFINYFDENARVSRAWELRVYPETFLIAPDGTLVQRIPGLREWDSPEMLAELESIYQQHTPNNQLNGQRR